MVLYPVMVSYLILPLQRGLSSHGPPSYNSLPHLTAVADSPQGGNPHLAVTSPFPALTTLLHVVPLP